MEYTWDLVNDILTTSILAIMDLILLCTKMYFGIDGLLRSQTVDIPRSSHRLIALPIAVSVVFAEKI